MHVLPSVCVQEGNTPLWIAAKNGHGPCVELLLGKGANVDQADKVGQRLQGVGAPFPSPPTVFPVDALFLQGGQGGALDTFEICLLPTSSRGLYGWQG